MKNKDYTHIAIHKDDASVLQKINHIANNNKGVKKSVLYAKLLEIGLAEVMKHNLINGLGKE